MKDEEGNNNSKYTQGQNLGSAFKSLSEKHTIYILFKWHNKTTHIFCGTKFSLHYGLQKND